MTDTRDNHELFPTDNPEYTNGPGKLPRRADAQLRMLLDNFQTVWRVVMDHPPVLTNEDRFHAYQRLADLFGQAFLLAVIREKLPADANRVAAGLADNWDAGDTLGEWVYQWRQELDAGQPLTLPIEPA